MPELPEVETVCRGISPHVIGKQITGVILRTPRLRAPLDPLMSGKLMEQTIVQVNRRAKYLLLQTTRGGLLVHLGMTGVLRVVAAQTPAARHDHVDLLFADGSCLRFTDPRRFGQFIYSESDPAQHPLLQHLGPEPLSAEFNGDLLYRRSRNRTQGVKPLLMDQRTVVGVGNIYANEALFRSGISPLRRASRVGRQRYRHLAEQVKAVLTEAISAGGTTISDFRDSDGRPGYFRQQLLVYGRAGSPCPVCGGTISCVRVGGRSTYFCRHCQK